MAQWLGSQPKRFIFVFALILVVFLGGLDYVTGPEISFSLFYLLPISMAAWFAGWRSGVIVSMEGVAVWFAADILLGQVHSRPWILYWNGAVRLGIFIIIAYTLGALNASRRRQQEMNNFIIHDLRSPLSIVITGLHTLRDFSEPPLSSEQIELTDLCSMSCNRMLILINSILDLARLHGGKMPLQLAQVDLKHAVHTAFRQFDLWAKQKDLTLSWSAQTGAESVQADPVIIERILVNLLTNALKFSPDGSHVRVDIAPHTNNMVAIRVSDQGEGIPREWAKRVFNKFTQVDAAKIQSGTGLGLSFCRSAVEAHGGQIWIDTEATRGTTVVFTLPQVVR